MMHPSKITRRGEVKRRHFQQSPTERGVAFNPQTLDFIPASCVLRPLRDQMIVQPIDVLHSRTLIIPPHTSKLVRGRVLAIGPGHYPNGYRDKEGNKNPPKGKRATMVAGTVFVPTEVKIGQIVHLDGRNSGKDAFDAFYHGDKYCIHCREADVAGIEV